MKEGYLQHNLENGRIGIIDRKGEWTRDGLHCGETMEALVNGDWISTRIEMTGSRGWYLVELPHVPLSNLWVRIP